MKKIIISLCICATFIVFAILIFQKSTLPKSESELFQAYAKQYFEETLSQDGLSMHFTLLNPSMYEITPAPANLPVYEKFSYQNQAEDITYALNELMSINIDELSTKEQQDYSKLRQSLTITLELADYLYYQMPFSPDSGMQTQLLILLANYRFTNREDVQAYFSILQSVPDYLNGLYLYLCDRTELGLIPSESTLKEVANQCVSILTEEEIQSNMHFLIETFQERLDALLNDSLISQSEYASYVRTNKELLLQYCVPAYETLSQNLLSLEGSLENEGGLATYPSGSTYYELQLQHVTASSKSITQLKELLTTSFESTYLDYYQTIQSIQNLQEASPQIITVSLPFTNTNYMVEDLRTQMAVDFPQFPDTSPVNYEIKEVSSSLELYTAPAFYLTPPLDDLSQNTIYVNYESPLDSLGLYTTLAHEGYPGHLYQSVYYYLSCNYISSQLLTPLLSYLGYVEGWAVYVENLSYEYAKNTLPESDETELIELYIDSYRLSRNLQLCFFSLLDIAIHYDGIPYADAHQLLTQFGITDPIQTFNLYTYIINNPTNYPTYYVGYCELLECKELAIDLWETEYNDLLFHTFFLELGPTNFEVIKEYIVSYVNAIP